MMGRSLPSPLPVLLVRVVRTIRRNESISTVFFLSYIGRYWTKSLSRPGVEVNYPIRLVFIGGFYEKKRDI